MVKIQRGRRALNAARGFINFEPPPEGLTPVGGGFYASPDVVSPTDCQWYPDSPFCGGNPISRTPIGLGAGLSISPKGITLSFQPTIGFVKLPHRAISWIPQGEYRGEAPPDKPEIPRIDAPLTSGGWNQGIPDNEVVYAGIQGSFSGKYAGFGAGSGVGYRIFKSNRRLLSQGEYLLADVEFTGSVNNYYVEDGENLSESIPSNGFFSFQDRDTRIFEFNSDTAFIYKESKLSGTVYQINEEVSPPHATIHLSAQFTSDMICLFAVYGAWKDIKNFFQKRSGWSDSLWTYSYACFGVVRSNPNPYAGNPPADYFPRECCMQCCSPTNNDATLDEILQILKRLDKNVGKFPTTITIFDSDENKPEAQPKTISIPNLSTAVSELAKRIEKISKIIGVNEFPITVPDTVLDESADDNWAEKILDWVTPNKERKITSVMQYLDWLSDNISAVDGKWPPVIEVQDADATTPGDQKKKVILFDKATATRELVIQNIQNYKLIGLIMDMVFKLLVEMASTKQEVVKAKLIVDEISQYLGYGTRQKSVDLGIQISPQGEPIEESIPDGASPDAVAAIDKGNKDRRAAANSLAAWLEPSKVKIPYGDWDGEVSLWEQFQHLATLISQQGQK
jgi:hypothetical protein